MNITINNEVNNESDTTNGNICTIRISKESTENFYYIKGLSPPNILMFAKTQQLQQLTNEISNNLQQLATHTSNTWQKNRSQTEIRKNTLQGKIVESFFMDLIQLYNQGKPEKHRQNNQQQHHKQNKKTNNRYQLSYLSYDEIRQDNMRKHAPFDGLLYQQGNPYLAQITAQIVADIADDKHGGHWGKISNRTRQLCREHRIYTVEIKSSKIPARVIPKGLDSPHKVAYQRQLIANLRTLDMFKYPHFNRKSATSIRRASDYFNWVRHHIPDMDTKSDEEIIQQELASSSDIYTRIFIDDNQQDKEGNPLFLAYILGYVFANQFYNELKITSFPSAKSKHALYATYPIRDAHDFESLFVTTSLWQE